MGPFERGIEHLRAGQVPSALAELDEARRVKSDGETFAFLAYSHSLAQQSRPAAGFYHEAIKEGYSHAWVHNNRAYELTQFDRKNPAQLRAAMEEATKARELAHEVRAVRLNWAYVRFLMNLDRKTQRLNDPECVEEIRGVMSVGPYDANLCVLAAHILAAASADAEQLQPQAIVYLRKAVELGKKPSEIRGDPVFGLHLAQRPDFKEMLALRPAFRPATRASLHLMNPLD
jgi:hypothetical protein